MRAHACTRCLRACVLCCRQSSQRMRVCASLRAHTFVFVSVSVRFYHLSRSLVSLWFYGMHVIWLFQKGEQIRAQNFCHVLHIIDNKRQMRAKRAENLVIMHCLFIILLVNTICSLRAKRKPKFFGVSPLFSRLCCKNHNGERSEPNFFLKNAIIF